MKVYERRTKRLMEQDTANPASPHTPSSIHPAADLLPKSPSSDPLADRRPNSKFWSTAWEDNEIDGEQQEPVTPSTQEFLDQAIKAGYTVEEVIEAEERLNQHKVKSADYYAFSTQAHCRASKMVKTMVNHPRVCSSKFNPTSKHDTEVGNSAMIKSNSGKPEGTQKPWKGPLPKQRVSPPKTLGDAVITRDDRSDPEVCLRHKVLKQVLPVTLGGQKSGTQLKSISKGQEEQWPALNGKSDISNLTKNASEAKQNTPEEGWEIIKFNGPGTNFPDQILISTIKGPALFRMHTGFYRLRAKAGSFPVQKKRLTANPKPQPPPGDQPSLTYAQVVSSSSSLRDKGLDQEHHMADRRGMDNGEWQGAYRGYRGHFDPGFGGRRPHRGRGSRRYQPRHHNTGSGRGSWQQDPNRERPNNNTDHQTRQPESKEADRQKGQQKQLEQPQVDQQKQNDTHPPPQQNVGDAQDTKKRAAQPESDQKDPKQKKASGDFCFRCYQPNHDKSVCTTELLCEICDAKTHLTVKCPHNRGPKLLAQPVGFAVDGLGYHHIPYIPAPEPKKPSKLALVSVEGGDMDATQVAEQLKRLMPGKWSWTAEPKGANTFLVPFPSKTELTRAVAFGSADLKALGKKLVFEEYQEPADGEPMPLAWLKIFDLPKNLKVKPVLWGIGSMLGATMKVDMKTSLHNDYGRVQVAVLNPKLIPAEMSVAVGRRWYSVRLEVESVEDGSEDFIMDEDDMDEDTMDYQDTDDREQDHQPDESDKGQQDKQDNSGDIIPIKGKSKEGAQDQHTQQIDWDKVHAAGWSAAGLNELEREQFITLKCKEIIEYAVDKEISACAARVAAEDDDYETMEVEPVVPDLQKQSTRSSTRTQDSAAKDTLEKATALKAKINLDTDNDKGYFQSNPLDPFLESAAKRGRTPVPSECLSQA